MAGWQVEDERLYQERLEMTMESTQPANQQEWEECVAEVGYQKSALLRKHGYSAALTFHCGLKPLQIISLRRPSMQSSVHRP